MAQPRYSAALRVVRRSVLRLNGVLYHLENHFDAERGSDAHTWAVELVADCLIDAERERDRLYEAEHRERMDRWARRYYETA